MRITHTVSRHYPSVVAHTGRLHIGQSPCTAPSMIAQHHAVQVAAKSGDDLEGDFQGLMDAEDPPDKGKKKKARKKHLL